MRIRSLRRSLLCSLLPLLLGPALAAAPADLSPVPARAPRHHLPSHWQHGVFMEIFVRAYQDSDGDGMGDLRGLIARLDHLQDLGIRGIWLMPVTASADRDHGYATTDFRAIEPDYGTLADFDELLRQAHRRGIGVVVDYVVNHASYRHPLFQEALKGPDNPYRGWFVWSDDAPRGWDIWGKNPWYHAASEPWAFRGEPKDLPAPPPGAKQHYFGTFGPHMPDFDVTRPEVWRWHLHNLNFWLNRGLDGFRLDAVPHLVETDAVQWNDQPASRRLVKQLQTHIKRYPNRYVVCEATAQPTAYGDPAVCGGAFAFGHVEHYVGAALGRAGSVRRLADYYRHQPPAMATFVSNHDIFGGRRLWDQVGGDEARYKLAAAGYLLQPGTPFVYYGEELGMASLPGLPGDQPVRGPMSWAPDSDDAGFTTGRPFRAVAPNVATHNLRSQRRDPQSILAFYKTLIGLRNRHPSIARGSYEHAVADGLVLGFQRRLGRERTLVLINYDTAGAPTVSDGLPPGARLRTLWAGTVAAPRVTGDAGPMSDLRTDRSGRLRLTLPPQSVTVLQVAR